MWIVAAVGVKVFYSFTKNQKNLLLCQKMLLYLHKQLIYDTTLFISILLLLLFEKIKAVWILINS